MTDSLRSALSAAFDASTGEEDAPAPDTSSSEAPTVQGGVSDNSPLSDASGGSSDDAAPSEASATETPAEAAQRARDEAGRFAKGKPKAPPVPKKGAAALQAMAPDSAAALNPGAAAPPQPAPTEAAPPMEKAPQSWTPTAREHWAKLPPEVRAVVDKREKEVARVLNESAPARQHFEAFQQTLQPYRALLTDEPLKVVGNLLQTAAQLQTGTPQSKAQMAAAIIKQYAVPIDLLDAALSGEGQPQAGQGGPQQSFDPDALVRQAEERVMQRMQQERQRAMVQREAANVEKFAAEHEFFEDVRPVMHALLQSGRASDLQDAYDKACWADPEVRAALLQRQQAQAATTQRASTQAALAAGVSVRSQPAAAPAPADTSLRGLLRANMDKASGR